MYIYIIINNHNYNYILGTLMCVWIIDSEFDSNVYKHTILTFD